MRKWSYLFFSICIAIFSATIKASSDDVANLIKVSPENNVKCVDYYTYKSELYCSTTPNPQPVDPHLKDYEKLSIQFDDRPWKIGWGKKDADATTIEYIPKGEDIENWNELVTSQFFPGIQDKVTPKEFADGYVKQWQKSGYKPIVNYLSETNDQEVIELRLEQPSNQAQDEMVMITKDNTGIYVLHYAIKTSNMSQEDREKWLDNLKNSSIKEE